MNTAATTETIGGIMDRIDSMLVAVPVGWLVLPLALG